MSLSAPLPTRLGGASLRGESGSAARCQRSSRWAQTRLCWVRKVRHDRWGVKSEKHDVRKEWGENQVAEALGWKRKQMHHWHITTLHTRTPNVDHSSTENSPKHISTCLKTSVWVCTFDWLTVTCEILNNKHIFLKKMYIKSVFKSIIHHIWLHLSDKWSPSEDQKLKGLQTKNRKLFLIHGYCCAFSDLSAACSFTWAQGTLTSLDSARAGSSRGLLGGWGL